MLNIDGTVPAQDTDYGAPILRRGFRPFFLGAALFAVISMAVWMAIYYFARPFEFNGLSPTLWHAHEMFFGYTMAVVAGFLLTAIQNWTGVEVLRGKALAALFLFWLLARILPFSGSELPLTLIAAIDIAFMLFLTFACLRAVLKVKQYKQLGIISKLFLLVLLFLAQLFFPIREKRKRLALEIDQLQDELLDGSDEERQVEGGG